MNMFAPKVAVQAPSRSPLPFGLFSVFQAQSSAERWLAGGIHWEALTCSGAVGFPVTSGDLSAGEDSDVHDPSVGRDTYGSARPFSIHGYYESTMLNTSEADAEARAEEHLLLNEQTRVEQALWTGDLQNYPNLVGENLPDDVDGYAVQDLGSASLTAALAQLEGFIATELGFAGVIHVSRHTASLLAAADLVAPRGGRLLTKLETPVVAGAGYTGSQMIVTPELFGYRSDVSSWTTANTRTNDLISVAARDYVIGFDPCGIARIEVTAGTGNGGGGNGASEVTIVGTTSALPVEVQNTIDTNVTNDSMTVSGTVGLTDGTQVEIATNPVTIGGAVTIEGVSDVNVTNDPLNVQDTTATEPTE